MIKKSNIIFGLRPVIEAILSGKEIDKILIQKELQGELYRELLNAAKRFSIPVQAVPKEKLNRVTNSNHQGVIALASLISYQQIENVIPFLYENGKSPLILILDGITDVGNFGAICRTAECSGVDAVIIPEKGAAQINPEAVKASAGALYKINVCRSKNLHYTIRFLKESGLQIIACTEKSGMEFFKPDYTLPTAVIMGAEDTGISRDCLKLADAEAKISVMGEIGSLNVSVAAGVILFEAVRQRLNLQGHKP